MDFESTAASFVNNAAQQTTPKGKKGRLTFFVVENSIATQLFSDCINSIFKTSNRNWVENMICMMETNDGFTLSAKPDGSFIAAPGKRLMKIFRKHATRAARLMNGSLRREIERMYGQTLTEKDAMIGYLKQQLADADDQLRRLQKDTTSKRSAVAV